MMENNYDLLDNNVGKKSNKKIFLIIILIILMIGIGVGGYFLGMYFASKENIIDKNKDNRLENSDIVEDEENKNDIKIDWTSFEYKVIFDKKADKRYLARLVKENSYEEILELDLDDKYYGRYDNKLYFSWADEMSYIDLTLDELIRKDWFNVTQPECDHNCFIESIYKIHFYDDVMYYNVGSSSYGGIMILDKEATSDTNRKSIIEDADFDWYFDEKREVIYYRKSEYNGGLYSYDINTNKSTMIEEQIEDFIYNGDDYLVYYDDVYNEYPLYLYNLNTNKKIELTSSMHSYSGCIWGNVEFAGDYVYFYDSNGKVFSYNLLTNKKEMLIDILNGKKNGSEYGINFIYENVIQTFDKEKKYNYIEDGKLIDSLDVITLTLLDGSVKTLDISNIEY